MVLPASGLAARLHHRLTFSRRSCPGCPPIWLHFWNGQKQKCYFHAWCNRSKEHGMHGRSCGQLMQSRQTVSIHDEYHREPSAALPGCLPFVWFGKCHDIRTQMWKLLFRKLYCLPVCACSTLACTVEYRDICAWGQVCRSSTAIPVAFVSLVVGGKFQ